MDATLTHGGPAMIVQRFVYFPWALMLVFLPTLVAARAGDILEQVPGDALGFVVVHNLAAVDSKVEHVAAMLGRDIPRPLVFLKQITGIADGLNSQGDFLLALLPAGQVHTGEYSRYAVWLPVSDYDRLLKTVGAKLEQGITVAKIAGEDVLVAHRGEWALVMDPDQRERMTKMLAAPPAPVQPIDKWKSWINANDVSVVTTQAGVRHLWAWLQRDDAANAESPAERSGDDLFGAGPANEQDAFAASDQDSALENIQSEVKTELRKWIAVSPGLARAIEQAGAIGFGIRLDESGNALAGARVAIGQPPVFESGDSAEMPFSLYAGGGFVLDGSGHFPRPIIVEMASAYLKRLIGELKTEERLQLDETTVEHLLEAVAQAAGDVRSVAVLDQPGAAPQPVYTNSYVAVRVPSADEFVRHANEVMRLWNKANRDAKGDSQFVFDIEEKTFGNRTATEYSLDIAAMDQAPVLPETRQAMEKFFGPGGKLRFWIMPIDGQTALLASATPEQIPSVLKVLDRKQPIDWRREELRETSRLLPTEADWRLYIDLHRYYDWLKRQTDAMVGVPVIGGPLVKDFTQSPPIGFAGGIRTHGSHELWIDVAAPADTIKSAAGHFKKKK
jgi:hypothetical protein